MLFTCNFCFWFTVTELMLIFGHEGQHPLGKTYHEPNLCFPVFSYKKPGKIDSVNTQIRNKSSAQSMFCRNNFLLLNLSCSLASTTSCKLNSQITREPFLFDTFSFLFNKFQGKEIEVARLLLCLLVTRFQQQQGQLTQFLILLKLPLNDSTSQWAIQGRRMHREEYTETQIWWRLLEIALHIIEQQQIEQLDCKNLTLFKDSKNKENKATFTGVFYIFLLRIWTTVKFHSHPF